MTGQMRLGLKDAMPIILAYVPVGITFGVVSTTTGVPWFLTILISLWVYAGAAQFMLVSLAASGGSSMSIIITLFLVNLRHVLYGTSLGPAFSTWKEKHKWIAAFGLTDEVYAVTSHRAGFDTPTRAYQYTFAGASYASWVLGTCVGAMAGVAVPPSMSNILGFSMPALFIALLMLGKRELPYLLAALISALVAVWLNSLGYGSAGILVGAVVGATIGFFIRRTRGHSVKRPLSS